jgi:hypothetical protein
MAEKITDWTLLKYIRDGKVGKASARHVMIALCMRANALKNFTCYPSYAQIMEDSVVCRSTVKSAVRDLEQAGWIKRKTRGRKSNLFYINVHQLKVASEEQLTKRGEGYPEASDDHFGVNTLICAGALDEARDNTDGLDVESLPSEEYPEVPTWLPASGDLTWLIEIVRQMWPHHPTFADARGVEYLTSDLTRCIDLVGTPYRCGHVLHLIYGVEAIRNSVNQSKKLGLYILACFPAWVRTYKDRLVRLDYLPEGEES